MFEYIRDWMPKDVQCWIVGLVVRTIPRAVQES